MTWKPSPQSHAFLPVAGHPDDWECTDREDGTDATYCGQPEYAHQPCEMYHEPPFDFACCETHDETFPLGGVCPFHPDHKPTDSPPGIESRQHPG